jgi:uncharacterized protein
METGAVTSWPRVVLDTNVYVSAFLSRNPTSPTQEIVDRWQAGQFKLLVSDGLVDELTEKLLGFGITPETIVEFLALLTQLAEWIDVPQAAIEQTIVGDADDDVILACAVVGQADFLVTYDPHFEAIGAEYRGIKIVKSLPFLWALRQHLSLAK